MAQPLDSTNVTHQDIAAFLRSAIKEGTFQPGDPIPSEAELCRQFGSARGTVRQAIATLRLEGMITSGQGRRSRVIEKQPSQSFDDVLSFSQWCHSTGITPGQQTQSLTRRRAGKQLAAELAIEPDDLVVSVHRLRLMDGVPAMIERLNYPLEVGQHLFQFDTDSGSIYAHLLESGVDIDHASRTIDAIGAIEEDAELLQIAPGTPMLRVRRRAYTSAGTPIESSDDRYIFDKASFTITSSRGNPQAGSMMLLHD